MFMMKGYPRCQQQGEQPSRDRNNINNIESIMWNEIKHQPGESTHGRTLRSHQVHDIDPKNREMSNNCTSNFFNYNRTSSL